MNGRRPRVCVLGEDDRRLLPVVRSLGRGGAAVSLGWAPPGSLARRSRHVTRILDELPRAGRAAGWEAALASLLARERFDLVMPADDVALVALHATRDVCGPDAPLALAAAPALAVALDRERAYAAAESADIAVPPRQAIAPPAAGTLPASWFPVVIEPRLARTLETLRRPAPARVADTPGSMAAAFAEGADAGEVVVRPQAAGEHVQMDVLARDGDLLAAVQFEAASAARGGGETFRTVPSSPDVTAAAARLLATMRYGGPITLRFRRTPGTGACTFVGMDPGFSAALAVSIRAGADLPWWWCLALAGGERVWSREYRSGVAARAGMLAWTWAADDPGPAVAAARALVVRAGRRTGRTGRALADRLPGVASGRAARAQRALGAGTVLFVCKGNICRSPFAEAYVRRRVGAERIRSAGYHPKADRPCPRHALAAARELDVDLAAHRSRTLDAAMVAAADAIFVFDDENWTTMASRFPEARRKLHVVAALDGGGRREIRDPYGGTLDDFRRAYAAIRRALDAALGAP